MQPIRTNRIADSAEFARVFDVSRETLARLATYERLLRTWQKTINLVAPSTLDDIWHRHFADSAQVVALAREALGGPPQHLQWVDLGSGGGFPGLVVGILWSEMGTMQLQLVDSDQRKAAFLREVVRETGLKSQITVDIVAARIETAPNHTTVGATTRSRHATVVSARALAPLPKLLAWALPYFGPETIGIFLKGRDAEAEITAASMLPGWAFETRPSLTDGDARVIVVRRRA